jgi:hypothetical protein
LKGTAEEKALLSGYRDYPRVREGELRRLLQRLLLEPRG